MDKSETHRPTKEVDEKTLVLRIPEDVEVPAFANFVAFNRLASEGAGDQAIVTFFHVYLGAPERGTDESQPKGVAVARISMNVDTAEALRNLLVRQLPIGDDELAAILQPPEDGNGSD